MALSLRGSCVITILAIRTSDDIATPPALTAVINEDQDSGNEFLSEPSKFSNMFLHVGTVLGKGTKEVPSPDSIACHSGFLHSEILIQAYRAVMIGPSAIDGRGTSTRATKKGNAQLNNMTDISIPSISYITTLVHFGLSSQGTFHVGGNLGWFNYHGFCHSIADLLGDERMVQQREALLRWWKGTIFSNVHEYNEPKGDTVHGKMLAQLEVSE
ncbi:hypothetical protein JB92DRAFT_3108706 [Gautieria morchelliformis]|nr:hypothetical protein JB92DRAFT_3108706 [Gautieria morchelliformis]